MCPNLSPAMEISHYKAEQNLRAKYTPLRCRKGKLISHFIVYDQGRVIFSFTDKPELVHLLGHLKNLAETYTADVKDIYPHDVKEIYEHLENHKCK